jgi:trimeric autotransporter adhesin
MKITTRSGLILLTFLSLAAVGRNAQAVSPPPDGCYTGFTTAEGCNALQSLSTGVGNTGVGWYSLFGDSTGSYNTAVGAGALDLNNADNNTAVGVAALLLNTTGIQNTATGGFALYNNSAGSGNVAIGYQAGSALTTGNNNIDIGSFGVAGESNTIRIGDPAIHAAMFLAGITAKSPAPPNQAVLVDPATGQLGSADVSSFGVVSTDPGNTAVGDQALQNNNGGGYNDAVGAFALSSNVDGSFNNALGNSALYLNIHASNNTAIGDLALTNNDSTGNGKGEFNTAVGSAALFTNTDGDSNNAVGFFALGFNTTGEFNQAIGVNALLSNADGIANVAIGDSAAGSNVSGGFNTVVGYFAGQEITDGFDNIYIGATAGNGFGNENATIRIGDPAHVFDCYIAGISGQTASGGTQVFISGDGKLGTLTSSARFKDNIKPMANASESILALKPVTFRYKEEIDPKAVPQFGLVAEEVEKVNPDLVTRDQEGKPYSVRYEAVNAMLLNEFLKEHSKVQELEAIVAQQRKDFETAIAQMNAQVQRVSAQLALAKSAPKNVVNNQ